MVGEGQGRMKVVVVVVGWGFALLLCYRRFGGVVGLGLHEVRLMFCGGGGFIVERGVVINQPLSLPPFFGEAVAQAVEWVLRVEFEFRHSSILIVWIRFCDYTVDVPI